MLLHHPFAAAVLLLIFCVTWGHAARAVREDAFLRLTERSKTGKLFLLQANVVDDNDSDSNRNFLNIFLPSTARQSATAPTDTGVPIFQPMPFPAVSHFAPPVFMPPHPALFMPGPMASYAPPRRFPSQQVSMIRPKPATANEHGDFETDMPPLPLKIKGLKLGIGLKQGHMFGGNDDQDLVHFDNNFASKTVELFPQPEPEGGCSCGHHSAQGSDFYQRLLRRKRCLKRCAMYGR